MDLAAHFRIPLFELMDRMSAGEFALWNAYQKRTPFGPYMDNYRAGLNVWAVFSSQGARNITPEQYMLGLDAEDNRFLSPHELAEKVKKAFGLARKGRKIDDSQNT